MEKISQIIEKISQLSVLKVVLISVLFLGLYYALVVQYDDSLYVMENSINMTQETINQKEKEMEDLKVLVERTTNLQEEYNTKTRYFNIFAGYMKQIENPTTFFSQMTNSFISIIGIQVTNYESKKAVIVKNSIDQSVDNYKLMPLEINLKGTFAQLLSFMSYLTESEQLISMETFKIKRIEADEAKGQLSLLSLKGEIALYSMLSEEDKLELEKGQNNDGATPNESVPAPPPGANQ